MGREAKVETARQKITSRIYTLAPARCEYVAGSPGQAQSSRAGGARAAPGCRRARRASRRRVPSRYAAVPRHPDHHDFVKQGMQHARRGEPQIICSLRIRNTGVTK